jgi:hypothetical protein
LAAVSEKLDSLYTGHCTLFTEDIMTEEALPRQRNKMRIWLALTAITAILAILIVPPFLSVSRYKSRITQLISVSLGRPVRLSSVEVRLLPRPGFLLTDLTVEEDPAYGAEPVLHANSVTASIRMLSLWRGRLEIDTISVDEASLNLVRSAPGHWNLDSLLRTATAQAQAATAGPEKQNRPIKLPYLKATHSRINVKNGVEKLPFSLLNAELSLYQQAPGEWRVRMRGQPVRTDLSLQQADTGIMRLDATMHQAPELRQMPVHLDLEWREAQLGQLTRLLFASDPGWRGDLTGELRLDGTADAAQVKTRLRATGVHRAEFAPASPMDFDASCTLVAHFTTRAIDNLLCDSPLGNGHIRLAGNLPADNAPSHFSIELDRIPVAAGLDALRTVRSNLAPGIQAAGSASGKITYASVPAAESLPKKSANSGRARVAKAHAAVEGPLTGSLTVDGLEFSGNGLSKPLRVPKLVLTPSNQPSSAAQALTATVAVPAGASIPLTVSTRLMLTGYQFTVRGQASIDRGRELALVAGINNAAVLDALSGDPISVELIASGPWMLPVPTLSAQTPPAFPVLPSATSIVSVSPSPGDNLSGAVTLHNASWKADYLTNPVKISQATLNFISGELRWDTVIFSYGPVKGTASITVPSACDAPQPCLPTFQLHFGDLDAAVLQAAFLGAHERSTMLSTLISRLRPAAAPAWPTLQGTVKADSLILGPVMFQHPEATLHTLASGAEITAFDADLLGGRIHGTGTFHAAASAKDKPSYALEAQYSKLSPAAVGKLFGLRSSGGPFSGNSKIEISGYTADDLASTAKGSLHFDWLHGNVAASSGSIPKVLSHFDHWTADAEIANSALTFKENQVKRGAHTASIQAAITLANPLKVTFASSKPAAAPPKAAPPKR